MTILPDAASATSAASLFEGMFDKSHCYRMKKAGAVWVIGVSAPAVVTGIYNKTTHFVRMLRAGN